MQNSDSYILIVDFSGSFVCSDNKRLTKMILKKQGGNLLDFVLPEFKDEIADAILDAKGAEVMKWNQKSRPFLYRFNYLPKSFSPVYDESGNVKHVLIYLKEITKEADDRLEINNNKFENLFNQANDAIFVTDTSGNFIEVNETAVKRTGFSRDEFLKINIKNTPIKSPDQTFVNYFQEILLYGESTAHINYMHTDGHIVETEISGKKLMYNGIEAILHISREVSVRNKIYSENIDALVQKEEKERSDFAYQINDVVGANLSMLKMYIESYFRVDNIAERNGIAEKIKLIIDHSLGTITELSNKISPHVLKNLGLKTAVEIFIEKAKESSGINFIFKMDIPEKITEDVEIILYRSVVEVIENIVKHSNAKKASLNAFIRKSNIVFEISDNGVGFIAEEAFSDKKNVGV
ncbi:MAG: PAS domain S-box protein [Chloroflexia bacterium]|nr:PAS domain S-box protein [Chloroflexia bacterium]